MNHAQVVVVVGAELRLFLRPGLRGGPVAVALERVGVDAAQAMTPGDNAYSGS